MSRFNLRRKPRVNYFEPEEPNMDEYEFCDHCGDYMFEYCSIHGPLLVVPDDKVSSNSGLPSYVPRAALTIPSVFLHLAPSTIPGAGLGVFTTLTMPRGVRFGPYRGLKTDEINSMYCWQIHDGNNKWSHIVDAVDVNKSNWMRYVNCARHSSEQNLVAYQYRGQIYYRTIKTIPRFTELLIFYGTEFARLLNVNLSLFNSELYYNYCTDQNLTEPNSMYTNQRIYREDSIDRGLDGAILHYPNTQLDIKNTSDVIELEDNLKYIDDNEEEYIESGTKSLNNLEIEVKENVDYDYQEECFQIGFMQESETNFTEREKSEANDDIKKKYECEYCGFNSTTRRNLARHKQRIHCTVYKCPICDQVFQTYALLRNHKNTHKVYVRKVYGCNVCSYKTDRFTCMQEHTQRHTKELIFKCNLCSYIGHVKRDFQRHVRVVHLKTKQRRN